MINSLLDYYVKIFERVETQSLKVRNEENKKLCCYFYNKGKLYDGKLMVVGRSGNGGSEENCRKQGDLKIRKIDEYIKKIYDSQAASSVSWVTKWWGHDKDEDGNKQYNPARSSFWLLIKAILMELYKESWDENTKKTWPELIVWSNIYKVSPVNGGNPNYTLQMLQLDYCKDILKLEIDFCRPKNILFVTGDWFKDVCSLFECNGSDMVYRYNDGTVANIYVCERPERKSPYKIAERIISEMSCRESA
ncbi:MAG: hypothetical protein GX625_01160 [Clostridiaceae bacterium]|nr:hypothetical protein [Clostridiaceae bacterium]